MSPEEIKAALRSVVHATIKGDPEGQAQATLANVLQAKMQARIMGTAGPETISTAPEDETTGDE